MYPLFRVGPQHSEPDIQAGRAGVGLSISPAAGRCLRRMENKQAGSNSSSQAGLSRGLYWRGALWICPSAPRRSEEEGGQQLKPGVPCGSRWVCRESLGERRTQLSALPHSKGKPHVVVDREQTSSRVSMGTSVSSSVKWDDDNASLKKPRNRVFHTEGFSGTAFGTDG